MRLILDQSGLSCNLLEFWVNVYSDNKFGRCWPDIYWAEASFKSRKVLYRIHVRMK